MSNGEWQMLSSLGDPGLVEQFIHQAVMYGYIPDKMESSYSTLTEALNALKEEGYTEDFNLLEDCMECQARTIRLFAQDFHVDKWYRFEDNNDPSDQAIVYAISSDKHSLKGVLVNSYGIYSDSGANALLDKLKVI
jgi:hypothetical protein